jgi:hypothetical protein
MMNFDRHFDLFVSRGGRVRLNDMDCKQTEGFDGLKGSAEGIVGM